MSTSTILGPPFQLRVRLAASRRRAVRASCNSEPSYFFDVPVGSFCSDFARAGVTGCRPLHPIPAVLLSFQTSLLPIALTGQRGFDSALLSRLQVKGVSFDLLDDVFIQYFSLEAVERVLQRLAFLESYLSQMAPSTLTKFVAVPDFAANIIRLPPPSEPWLGPAFPSVPCWI